LSEPDPRGCSPETIPRVSRTDNVAILPVVRYMLLCEDWANEPVGSHRIVIYGLLTHLRSRDDPPYPLLYREMCIFLALTEIHEEGEGRIIGLYEDDGQQVINVGPRLIPRASDPLAVVAVPFRIRDIYFPRSGICTVQFWFAGELVEQRPLQLR
jgi:hypothetical protein